MLVSQQASLSLSSLAVTRSVKEIREEKAIETAAEEGGEEEAMEAVLGLVTTSFHLSVFMTDMLPSGDTRKLWFSSI